MPRANAINADDPAVVPGSKVLPTKIVGEPPGEKLNPFRIIRDSGCELDLDFLKFFERGINPEAMVNNYLLLAFDNNYVQILFYPCEEIANQAMKESCTLVKSVYYLLSCKWEVFDKLADTFRKNGFDIILLDYLSECKRRKRAEQVNVESKNPEDKPPEENEKKEKEMPKTTDGEEKRNPIILKKNNPYQEFTTEELEKALYHLGGDYKSVITKVLTGCVSLWS